MKQKMSNILLVGSIGCRLYKKNFRYTIADGQYFTEAGYVGEDAEKNII